MSDGIIRWRERWHIRCSILATFGSEAADAVPVLVETLGHANQPHDPDCVRVFADVANVLGNIGPAAMSAAPLLNDALESESREIRAAAAGTLGRLGLSTERALQVLLDLAGEDGTTFTQRAHLDDALAHFGTAAQALLPSLLQELCEEGENGRRAARSLGAMRAVAATSLPVLERMLHHEQVHVRRNALTAVGYIAYSKTAENEQLNFGALIPGVLQVFENDEDATIRYGAADFLRHAFLYDLQTRSKFGTMAIPMLMRALKSDDYDLCGIACETLGLLGSIANPAVEDLRQVARQDASPAQHHAIHSLNRFESNRSKACIALMRIGGDAAKFAVQNLAKWIRSDSCRFDDDVMFFDAERDDEMATTARVVLPILTKYLCHDSNCEVRATAARAIGQLGVAARSAAPALIDALSDDDVVIGYDVDPPLDITEVFETDQDDALYVSTVVAQSLAWIGADGKAVIAELIRLLKAGQFTARQFVIAITELNEHQRASPGAAILVDALSDEHASVRLCAATTLGRIGRCGHAAVPKLAELLSHDPDEEVRAAAAYALGCHQVEEPSIDCLIKALETDRPFVQRSAARALLENAESSERGFQAIEKAVPALAKAMSGNSGSDRVTGFRTTVSQDLRTFAAKALSYSDKYRRRAISTLLHEWYERGYVHHSDLETMRALGAEHIVPAVTQADDCQRPTSERLTEQG